MNFKSQICTSREQSQKLLSLGLKPETADMNYHHTNSRIPALEWELQPHRPTTKKTTSMRIERLNYGGLYKHEDGTLMSGEEVFEQIWGKDVPAWSLARLLEIIPKRINVDNDEITSRERLAYFAYLEGLMTNFYNTMKTNVFDAMVALVEWEIQNGHFNKEYLNQ